MFPDYNKCFGAATGEKQGMLDLFLSPEESKHAMRLLGLPDTRFAVARSVGGLFLSDTFVPAMPHDQIFVILSKAPFEIDEEECVFVASVFFHLMRASDVLPMAMEHHGLELANRCLVSLSLFYDAMEKRWQRHGSPAPDFYRKAGKRAFAAEEKRAIADHFEKWEAYCGEVFA